MRCWRDVDTHKRYPCARANMHGACEHVHRCGPRTLSGVTPLDPSVIAELGTFSTPSIANGIETFDVRARHAGYMDASVRCMFPDLTPMVGYAATATIRSQSPGESANRELWAHVYATPGPRIVVVQDLDDPPGTGSLWGEVNANILQAFGAIGVVTNGCVRDLDEMRALGFHAFAGSVGVSHAYVHIVEVNVPVTVGGLRVEPGDLLHGDKHGVSQIPLEIAENLPDAIRTLEAREREIIATFRGDAFSAERFIGEATT
jgi:4-hydroxy-4-methyl-2-oxoglutarate aldolase